MQILTFIHDLIFNKASSGKSNTHNISDESPEELGGDDNNTTIKPILMTDSDDLATKQFHSSMLEYHVLLLLHKLLFYSTMYSRQNSRSKIHKIKAFLLN